jgi:hypothetical protein
MGRLHLGTASEPIADVDLAHLELVVATRLGSAASTRLTVEDAAPDGSGGAVEYRLDEDSPLRFAFDVEVPHDALDPVRLRIMLRAAGGPHGLHVARSG